MSNTFLFENERVRVSNFILPSGHKVLCEHPFNTIRWQVGTALHQKDNEDPKESNDKEVHFVDAGTTFHLANRCSIDSRQIIFEIKQPPKYTETEVSELLSRAIYPTNVGTKLLFENRYCRVWDFYLDPDEGGTEEYIHHHVLDNVFVYVAPGRLIGYHTDGTPGLFDSINNDNDVTWSSIPSNAPELIEYAHGGKNGYKDKPMREYLVELK